jgi:hypothetical protein
MIIEKGFEIIYNIEKIGSIKSWKESEMAGRVNPPFVKFRSVIVEGKEDPDVGLREIETIVDFQVTTNTLEEAVLLAEKIRKMRVEKKEVLLSGALPNKEKTDEILRVKSLESLEDFLKRNNITLAAAAKKQA